MFMLAQFAIRMICGMSLVLAGMPHATVASGFFRVSHAPAAMVNSESDENQSMRNRTLI